MTSKIGGFSKKQYDAFVHSSQKSKSNNHWFTHSPILHISLNRLVYFLLHHLTTYPNNTYLFCKFKSHKFNKINTLEEYTNAQEIFNKFKKCEDLLKVDSHKQTLDKIGQELSEVHKLFNKEQKVQDEPFLDDQTNETISPGTVHSKIDEPKISESPIIELKIEPIPTQEVTPLTQKSASNPPQPPKMPINMRGLNTPHSQPPEASKNNSTSPRKVTPGIRPPPVFKTTDGGGPLSISAPKYYFENEPLEPDALLLTNKGANDLGKMGQEQLKKQIVEIEKYLDALKKTIDPIEKTIQEEKKDIDILENEMREDKITKSQLSLNEKNLKILSEESCYSILKLRVKDGEELDIPFLSEERYAEVNKKLIEKGHSSGLPLKFAKGAELKFIEKKIDELKDKESAGKALIDKTNLELKGIREMKNNGILFNEFKKKLPGKIAVRDKWDRALMARQKQLKNLEAPQKPEKSTLQAKAKLTVLDVLETEPDLKEEFPELAALEVIFRNQNAHILLRGDEYHNQLSP